MDRLCLIGRTDEGLRQMGRILDELDEKNAQAGILGRDAAPLVPVVYTPAGRAE